MFKSEQIRVTIKRYVLSTLITFFTGMAIVLVPVLGSEEFTIEAIKNGALVGVLFSGVRLGLKMVLEVFLANNIKKEDTLKG